MESSKYLIAAGTTDWVKSLAPYYADDEAKRRRHGEQLRQRDQAAIKAMAASSPIKMLEKLSSFSQTLGKLSQQQKKIAAQNEQSERLEADVLLTKNIKNDEWDEINRITRESVNDLKFEGALFIEKINASEYLSPAAKKTLTAQHGSSIYRIHEQIGFRSLSNLDAAIEAYGATEAGKTEDFQAQLDEVRASGDHIAEKNIYKKFAFKQFNTLGFNDKFIATNFSKPLDKFISSKGVMSQLMYEKIHHTEQELAWDERFDTARKKYDSGDDPLALTNEFHTQIVESNKNKGRIVTNYYRLAKSGKLTRDEFRALREGDLDEKLGFKAGSTGKDLLDDEQWAQIERGISEHEAATVKGYKNGISQQALTTLSAIYKGEASIEELTAMRDETMLRMSRAGLTNTDAYRQLEDADVSLQKPESYAAIRKDNHDYFGGKLQSHRLKDKENFKATIKNGRVLSELNDLVAEDERYYRDVGLPTTHKDHVKLSAEILKNSKGQKQRLSTGIVTTSTEFKNLSQEMALKRQEFHIIARAENQGNTVRANAQAEDAFLKWQIANGINEIDNGKNPNAGILSPTNEGIYRISKEKRAALTERSAVGTQSNTIGWGQDMSIAYTESGGNKNTALNTANSFTSHGDIQGVFMNGVPDINGNIKPYYSPEIIFKARALRIQPAQLILKQIQALQNGDHKDRDFYKRHNLKAYEEILKNDPAVKIEEALENLADNKLLFLWRNGVENMSANQITRLIDSLSGFKWHKALTETREKDETFGHTIRTFK